MYIIIIIGLIIMITNSLYDRLKNKLLSALKTVTPVVKVTKLEEDNKHITSTATGPSIEELNSEDINNKILENNKVEEVKEEPISINIVKPKYTYAHGSKFKQKPTWIVVHYTACINVSAKSMCKAMVSNKDASSHFYIDENDICAAVPEEYIAWHVGSGQCKQPSSSSKKSLQELANYKAKDWRYDLAAKNHLKWIEEGNDFKGNSQSIGVDMCVCKKSSATKKATDRDWYFTSGTIDNTAKTVAYLAIKYNISLEHIIRHGDCTGKLCLPVEDTEIMTPNGFVKLSDISVGDTVYQYNPNTKLAEATTVLSKVEPYTTNVCKNRNFEATLNHRMIVESCRKHIHECQFSDLLGKSYYYITSCNNSNQDCNLTDDQIRLLIQVQGDGHFEYKYTDRKKQHRKLYYLSFHLKKERKILNLRQLLNRMNLQYTECIRSDGTVYFRIKINDVKNLTDEWLINKCFSNKFLNLSKRQFEIFLDELWKVDACVTTNKLLYCTTQKQNLDVVQTLCTLNDIRTHFYMQNNAYMLSIVNSRHSSSMNNYTFNEKLVSCIEVPSSYIIIRQNGSTFITGNCPRPFISISPDETNDEEWEKFKDKIKYYINRSVNATFI